MMYPCIVLCFAMVMVVALFLFVLPRFKDIFTSMDIQLPPAPRRCSTASDWLQKFWWIALVMIIGGVVAFKQYAKTTKGRYNIDKIKLKLPIFGTCRSNSACPAFHARSAH